MNPTPQVSLQAHSTMRLGGKAAYLTEVTSRIELTKALDFAAQQGLPVIMIGDGSNIIWKDEGFPGLVIVNKITRYEDFAQDEPNHYVTVGAGENWDSVVARTVNAGLTGIEALSLVPGTAGATPVQNVGAYGQEISDTLVSVEAYDTYEKKIVIIPSIECGFDYRASRFKGTDRGRFMITALTLHLIRGNPAPPFYKSLQSYLTEHEITEFTPKVIRDAVVDIRSHKLPDPAKVANVGSFFANPVVDEGTFAQLKADYEDIVSWPTKDGKIKLSAAWLIERAGLRDFHDPQTGMSTWATQPLVLVNEHATSTAQLLYFKQQIINIIKAKFDVTLIQEPELLP